MKDLNKITVEDVKAAMKAKGYDIFTGSGVPNIVGVRSTDRTGKNYDDKAFVWWAENGTEESHIYTITTNPGEYYLRNPITDSIGTAILVPGQYMNCWELGAHGKTKQLALVQRCGQVRVFRDKNKDGNFEMDPKTIDTGYFGINLHHGSISDTDVIGQWSAGCQVWRYHQPHEELMQKFTEMSQKYGFSRFSYTLLDQADIQ